MYSRNYILIRFSSRKKFFSRLVRLFTWSWASHVDFVLPNDNLLGAVPLKGVIIYNRLEDEFDREEYYKVNIEPSLVLRYAANFRGADYDWSGILGFIFRSKFQNPNAWFCSEFIAHCLEANNIKVLKEQPWRITPRDLLMSTVLEKIEV